MHAQDCLRFLVLLGFYVFICVKLRPMLDIRLVSFLLVNIDVLTKRLFMLAGDHDSGVFFVYTFVKLFVLLKFGV